MPCILFALAAQKYSHTVVRMNSEPLVASLPWHEIKIPQWDGCREVRGPWRNGVVSHRQPSPSLLS